MLCNRKDVVVVATTAELKNYHYYCRLWMAARNISLPRRQWLDELAACFRDYRGNVMYPSGELFPIPFVDDVFGDDPDMRWLSYYLSTDGSGKKPRSLSRKLQRVQLIDLYFRIRYPSIARHFSR